MPPATKSTVANFLIFGFFHFVMGVGLSMVVGFVPEALLGHLYYNTGVEAFGPAIAMTGLILGLFFSVRVQNGQGAGLAWIFGALWLGVGFHGVASAWSPTWARRRVRGTMLWQISSAGLRFVELLNALTNFSLQCHSRHR